MNKHHPTPWKVEDRRGAPLANIRIVDACGREVAQASDVFHRDGLVCGWTHAQADAVDAVGLEVANLLAAAPKLLEACQMALDRLMLPEREYCAKHEGNVILQLEAAIAEAKYRR